MHNFLYGGNTVEQTGGDCLSGKDGVSWKKRDYGSIR